MLPLPPLPAHPPKLVCRLREDGAGGVERGGGARDASIDAQRPAKAKQLGRSNSLK